VDQLCLLSGRAHPTLAAEIATYLGLELASVELGNFPDGEISVRLNHNVRGCDVFLVQPTGPSVNENLMELLILIDTCRRASAARITLNQLTKIRGKAKASAQAVRQSSLK